MGRGKFSFWLDYKHDDSLLIAETIDDLKRERSFSSVVRQGIVIISELRKGRIDTLLACYPWIKDAILELFPPTQPPPTDEITELKRMIERLIEQQGRALPDTRDSGGMLMISPTKPYTAPPVIAPKAAPVADAGAIADAFMAFIQ